MMRATDNFRHGVRSMAPVGVWLRWTEVLMLASRFGMDAHTVWQLRRHGLVSAWQSWIPCLEIANIPQTMLVFVCCQRVKKPMCSLFFAVRN